MARLRKAVRSRREGATATGVARRGARGAVGGMAQNEARGQVRRAAGGRTASSRTPRPSWMDCGNALVGSSPTMYAHMLKAAEVWRTPPAVGTTPACACRPTAQEAVSTSSGDDDDQRGPAFIIRVKTVQDRSRRVGEAGETGEAGEAGEAGGWVPAPQKQPTCFSAVDDHDPSRR